MSIRFRLLPALFSVIAATALARPALAQACVGLPGGRGMLSVGFEGTDGATGQGVGFAYQAGNAALVLQHRSLDVFSLAGELSTSEVQASVGLPSGRLPLCLTAGVQRTAYDDDRHESTSWVSTEPEHEVRRYRVGGPYRGLRVPVGVSLGRELRVNERLSLVPFVRPAVVFQRESYQPETGPEQTRSGWGLGAAGGVSVAYDWLVLRSTLSHTTTPRDALSTLSDFPTLSVHAGVRF
jgi:hypothetical protein